MILATVALVASGGAWARPPSAGFVDSATRPIRCHYEETVDPTRCDAVLGYAEAAWAAQVDGMGFVPPPSDGGEGGSDALDLYLGTTQTSEAGEAWVDCDGGDGTCADEDAADGLARAPSYVVIDARTSAMVMEGYVTHELNHTFQYGADYAEPFLSVWEGTAVAAEVWTLGEADASQVADYQATPWLSAVLQDGYFLDEEYGLWSYYEYGAVTWMLWMDERYGEGDGRVAPELWAAMSQEGYAYEPDVLDAWESLSGLPWETELREFARWRAALSDGDDLGPWPGAATAAWREGTIGEAGTYSPAWPVFPMGMAVWDVGPDVACGSFEVTGEGRWEVIPIYTGDPASIAKKPAVDECSGVRTIAVVSYGPDGLDADDALTAETFTLTVTEYAGGGEGGGCGCGTGSPVGAAWVLGLVAALRRRRRGA